MKKLILSLLMVIGIITSGFSQSTYPKKILYENDTVLAITRPQLVTITRSLNGYIHLKKAHKLLQVDLLASDSLVFYWKSVSLAKDTVIRLEQLKYDETVKFNESLKTDLRNEKKKCRKRNFGVGIGGTLLGILLGVICFK